MKPTDVARRVLELRITGLDERDLRRWRRYLGTTSAFVGLARSPAKGLLTAAIVLASGAWAAHRSVPGMEVEQTGVVVRGRHVLLVQDVSGSMSQHEAVVRDRLAALRDGGAYSEVGCQLGGEEFIDFVTCVEAQIGRDEVDGIYVFGDFEWDYTPDGLRRVSKAVGRRGTRMYLETVRFEPHAELASLAESSGGGVIRTPQR
jgi:hypothetical protein